MYKHVYFLTRLLGVCGLVLGLAVSATAQAVLNPSEKIERLVTFGAQAPATRGDDDFTQTFFFPIPATGRPLYNRVFDPNCGGQLDAKVGQFNTRTDFSLYGGPGTHSAKGATDPRPAKTAAPLAATLSGSKCLAMSQLTTASISTLARSIPWKASW